jgi:hypothetical protein
LTNLLAVLGLAVLSLSMIGAVTLVCDWVAGDIGGVAGGSASALVFGVAWFAFPLWLRRTNRARLHRPDR